MTCYRSIIEENIDYPYLNRRLSRADRERLEVIIDVMLETVVNDREKVRIGRKDIPYQVVKSCFLKLNRDHILYVLECMNKAATPIGNIEAYLLTVLYRAPKTMNKYYHTDIGNGLERRVN